MLNRLLLLEMKLSVYRGTEKISSHILCRADHSRLFTDEIDGVCASKDQHSALQMLVKMSQVAVGVHQTARSATITHGSSDPPASALRRETRSSTQNPIPSNLLPKFRKENQ